MSDQRATPRIPPFVAPCRFACEDGRRAAAFLTDLSIRGARLHCDVEPPTVGETVTLEVRMGRRVTHARIPALVRWSRPAAKRGFSFGVRFESVGPEEQKLLDGVVAEFHRRAAQLA